MKKFLKADSSNVNPSIWDESYKSRVDDFDDDEFYDFVNDYLMLPLSQMLDESDKLCDKLVAVYKDASSKDFESFKANLEKALLD